MSSTHTPVKIFCSCDHEDELLLKTLEAHLSPLTRQGLISIHDNLNIPPGTNKAQFINTQLEQASIILLLISPHFVASDDCYQTQMHAVQQHNANPAQVIPIILRPCNWGNITLVRLQCLPSDGNPITKWENQDDAWHNVVIGIHRVIQDLSPPVTGTLQTQFPPIWNVPYPQNPFFTGRDDLLTRLHAQWHADQTTATPQPQALCGLGGIGKTQLAVEYAYRYRQDYEVILWAHAETQETIISSYNSIATLLNLPEREASQQEITIQVVKKWLQTHQKWLLILDNANDLALIPPFLPQVLGGHLLLTTQAQAMGHLARPIKVKTLSDEQGALLLLRRAALISSDATFEQASIDARQLAIQITHELGVLPLAIDQAGAYIEETGNSLTEYQQIYQSHRATLLKDRCGLISNHPESVATTLSLSFQRVQEKNAAAADLLRLCAFLAPNAIPKNIITQGVPHLSPLLKPVAADSLRLSEAIKSLRAYSLIECDSQTQTLLVHQLVQTVLHDNMTNEELKVWKQRVVRAVNASCPHLDDLALWDAREQWFPHVQVCATWIEQENMTFLEVAQLLNKAGYYWAGRALSNVAEPSFQRSLKINEEQLGHNHLETANSLNNLACVYKVQHKYTEAEPLYERALSIREKQWGASHPHTAQSLNNLAELYQAQDKYTNAEPLYICALTIYKQQLGPQHPDTRTTKENYATLLRAMGRDDEAAALETNQTS